MGIRVGRQSRAAWARKPDGEEEGVEEEGGGGEEGGSATWKNGGHGDDDGRELYIYLFIYFGSEAAARQSRGRPVVAPVVVALSPPRPVLPRSVARCQPKRRLVCPQKARDGAVSTDPVSRPSIRFVSWTDQMPDNTAFDLGIPCQHASQMPATCSRPLLAVSRGVIPSLSSSSSSSSSRSNAWQASFHQACSFSKTSPKACPGSSSSSIPGPALSSLISPAATRVLCLKGPQGMAIVHR